jgi:hypothetical protein
MIFQKIFLFLIMSNFSSDKLENQKIEVIGKAINAKLGAVVVSDDKGVFYLYGLASWDKEIYEKKVKVTGKLVVKEWEKIKEGEPIVATMEGSQKIIKRPKWILVD